ncbi:hypothetical protein [Rhizobium phage RHEph12]|nr:hypothetical protein [Rhizobium phage RHEph12]
MVRKTTVGYDDMLKHIYITAGKAHDLCLAFNQRQNDTTRVVREFTRKVGATAFRKPPVYFENPIVFRFDRNKPPKYWHKQAAGYAPTERAEHYEEWSKLPRWPRSIELVEEIGLPTIFEVNNHTFTAPILPQLVSCEDEGTHFFLFVCDPAPMVAHIRDDMDDENLIVPNADYLLHLPEGCTLVEPEFKDYILAKARWHARQRQLREHIDIHAKDEGV